MSNTVIKIEHLAKQYHLGQVGTGTISHDINRWWHKIRGNEDPYLTIGEENDRSKISENQYAWALKDINFEVKKGEILGIIGKNGAGKSTLLKILSRVTEPTIGSLKTKGRIASLLEVGTGFHPEMTGRENIFMNGTIMGMRRHEVAKKLDEIVEFAGIAKYLDTPTKRYSSGMTVRLGFSIAAHLEPEILIVDEVLAVGDAQFQKKAIGKMKDVSSGEGRTVLFVSHNLNSINQLCTKALLLDKGRISMQGAVPDVLEKYNSENITINKQTKINLDNIKRPNDLAKTVRFSSLHFISPNNSTTLPLGQSFSIQLGIKRININQLRDIEFAIGINDNNETRIVTAVSQPYNSIEIRYITFDFSEVKLNRGKYGVTILARKGKGNRLDLLKNVFSFEILEIDYSKNHMSRPGIFLPNNITISIN